jgi:hypothetical protein
MLLSFLTPGLIHVYFSLCTICTHEFYSDFLLLNPQKKKEADAYGLGCLIMTHLIHLSSVVKRHLTQGYSYSGSFATHFPESSRSVSILHFRLPTHWSCRKPSYHRICVCPDSSRTYPATLASGPKNSCLYIVKVRRKDDNHSENQQGLKTYLLFITVSA